MKLSKLDQRLLTYFNFASTHFYTQLGQKYNIIFNRYRSLIPHPDIRLLLDIILKPALCLSENDFLDYLKAVGTYTLAYITTSGTHLEFRFLLELQNLSGYDTALHHSYNLFEDVRPFYQPCSEYIIPDDFKLCLNSVIDNLPIIKSQDTYEMFIAFRDNYNIDGVATVGHPLTIQFQHPRENGKTQTRSYNTKYFSQLAFTNEEIVYHSLKNRTAYCKPFMKKDEAYKDRTVIGYDTWSFDRCSYLERFIDIKGVDFWSTLKADPIHKLKARKIICNALKEKKKIICIDQSAFDQHQPKELILYCLERLFSRIKNVNIQTRDVVDAEFESLKNVYLYINEEKTKLARWTKGLLSGYKFTALLGSLLNKAEFLYVCKLCNINPLGGFFQGDDAIAWFSHPISKDQIAAAYSSLGFEVNPLKTWYGTKCTEFLREIYIEDHVYGIPSRMGLALIFDKPKPHKLQPDHRWVKNNSNLMKAKRRGLLVDKIIYQYNYNYLASHYLPSNRLGVTKFNKFLRDYLSTPAALGGLGIFPLRPYQKFVTLTRHVRENTKSDFVITSKLVYHPIKEFDLYLRKKLKDRIQLGNKATLYSFHVIDKTRPLNYHPIHIKNISLPPFDWNYPADEHSNEFYVNRLNYAISQSPLPTLQYPKKNFLSATKFINLQYSFDDYLTTQESHLHFSKNIMNTQRYLCHCILLGKYTLDYAIRFLNFLIIRYYYYIYNNNLYTISKFLAFSKHNYKHKLFSKYFSQSTSIIISV